MRDLNVKLGFVVAVVSFAVATACGDDGDEKPAGTGGAPGSGGAASGGANASGGTPGSGGAGAGGGPVATGGATTSTGGATTSTGGAASGGAASGGAASGGAASGGAASGGAASGGAASGGAASGGANGSGGSSGAARCDVYCDLQSEKCGFGEAAPANYTTRGACTSYCAESLASKAGTVGAASGDTLECRITHLNYITSTSSAGDKTLHCGHSGKTPTSGCN